MPSSNRVKLWLAISIAVLLVACLAPLAIAGKNAATPDGSISEKKRGTEPTYSITAGLDGDIFPAFANYLSFQKQTERNSGIVTVAVSNSSDKLVQNRVAVQISGWSDQEIQMVELAAGQVRKLNFAPTFLPRFYGNREIASATAKVIVSDMAGREVWSTTVPVQIRSADDMYWGKQFEYAKFIASWVTPHDPNVEMTLSRAKEYMPARRLPGYEIWHAPGVQEKSTYLQVKAIYNTLQKHGLSYVKSSMSLGGHINSDVTERVRTPAESLRQASANCIDGVVLYASLFENLGLEPVVVLVPGHAYVGVKLSQDSDKNLYLETSLTGRAPFEQSVKAAERGLTKYNSVDVVTIPITRARQAGVYPMPHPTLEGRIPTQMPGGDVRQAN